MIYMTEIEKEVLAHLVDGHFRNEDVIQKVVHLLVVSEREITEDVSGGARCVGFYTNFEANRLLEGIDNLPHHISLHAEREGLEAGADFILFTGPSGEIRFLEASFYGHSLLTEEVLSKDHGFRFDQ
jgi:hypothetical protein